ncbi:MAG TPA: hypothetical protein VFC19_15470 [Candidatus Limnocylindrales bacterium]|nr:hypothetical protein [Candidatus Limnocylindrales bacterium]
MSLSEQFTEPAAGVTGDCQERSMQVLLGATIVATGFVLTPMFQPSARPLAYALWTVLGGVIVLAGWRRAAGRSGRAGDHEQRALAAIRQLDEDAAESRLQAVRTLAEIADLWAPGRQACIDALCAYLRRPSLETDPERRVRKTAIRLIGAHLRPDAVSPWHGCDLNLAGAVIDGGCFAGADFSSGVVDFTGARFVGDSVLFSQARFTGATVRFTRAHFAADKVDFGGAEFGGGSRVDFSNATVDAGTLDFSYCRLSRSSMSFDAAQFVDGLVDFYGARLDRSKVSFSGASFGATLFRLSHLLLTHAEVSFLDTRPAPEALDLTGVKGTISFGVGDR